MKTIALFKIGAIFLYGNLSPVVLNLFNALMLIAIFGTLIYLILRKKNPEIHLSHTESIIPMATKKEISSSSLPNAQELFQSSRYYFLCTVRMFAWLNILGFLPINHPLALLKLINRL